MVRKSLIVAVLLTIASPLAAQEEYVWTSQRPDGHAPIGVMGARTLELGVVEFSYRFSQLNSRGVWVNNDSIPTETTLEFYTVAPVSLTNQNHNFSVAVGATESLSFIASIDYSSRQREQLTGELFYVTEAQELGDLQVTGLYNFVDSGPYRAHLQVGALIPTGSEDVIAETPFSTPDAEAFPYDMRPGAGTFGFLPGMTVQVQNEVASIGAQIKAMLPLGTNSRDYSLGNTFDASGWAAYRLNDYFSASARVHWQNWGGIQGADPALDVLQDPGNDGFFLEGERVDLPIGMNFFMPEGSKLEGHRLSFEAIFPVHHEYRGAQLALDWGVTVGWQVVF